jgi:hypothetical protein
LSHIKWPDYAKAEDSITKILMDGLTNRPPAELAALAKSWLHPASAEVTGAGFESKGYDPAERAFVVRRTTAGAGQLNLRLIPSQDSLLLNPAVLVKSWNAEKAQVVIDGKLAPVGTVRMGNVTDLDGTDLVIFIQQQSGKPMEIVVKANDSKVLGKR